MFNPLLWLDDKLSAATQTFCDKFQITTGRTKYFLQKWLLIMSSTFLWVSLILKPMLLLLALSVVYTFGIWETVRRIEKEEAQFLENPRAISRSDTEWCQAESRLLTFLYIGIIIVLVTYVYPRISVISIIPTLIALTAYPYVAACIPLPPRKSKAREWCEKALAVLINICKPAPALSPVTIHTR